MITNSNPETALVLKLMHSFIVNKLIYGNQSRDVLLNLRTYLLRQILISNAKQFNLLYFSFLTSM